MTFFDFLLLFLSQNVIQEISHQTISFICSKANNEEVSHLEEAKKIFLTSTLHNQYEERINFKVHSLS